MEYAVGQEVEGPSPGICPTIFGESADLLCSHD